MGATPQLPRDDYAAWQKSVEAQIALLHEMINNPLANTGLSVPSAGIVECDGTFNVVGTENVSGNLSVSGTQTVGGNLNVTGSETVSGNLTVSGTLVLPNGSVNNDWLVNPSSPQAVYDSVQNFSLSTTLTNIRTTNVTIPAGFTKAAVQLTVRAYATNPNTTGGNNGAGGDYLYAQANVNGFNGYALPTGVSGSNGSGTNVSTFAAVLTGLTPGGTISLQCAVQTGFLSWAANSTNTVDLSASIGWYR